MEEPSGGEDSASEVLWDDGERRFCRVWRYGADGACHERLAVFPTAEHPTQESINRLEHEYELREYIDGESACRPLEIVRERGHTALLLEYHGGAPLVHLIARPMEIGPFLRFAVGLAGVMGRVHARGVIHKDIKPANILVDEASDRIWLMGFGVASRLPRERQAPEAPGLIAGTFAHMSPEQTGRMNRSIDSRSDLYSVGVTLYQALTGSLPFTATDPMEWVHCHIARKPIPPKARVEDIPSQVSAIVMKLLAKTPEERYQTAAGVERDLRRCLNDWDGRRAIAEFPLGERDRADRLVIPEKLYGREREIETLLASFDRVVITGPPRLLLLSGPAGIGKSSVVNELHKVLVPPRGLFASGKFDQLKRDIPYATLAEAFRSLIRRLLSMPEAELSTWRNGLREALDPNRAPLVDLIPELKFVIGEQPTVRDVPTHAARAHFQLAFRRLIGVFARPDHPLVLFLDDLQWLDTATLDLLEGVLGQAELQHLLIIGAYRDNEVDEAHPLVRKLAAIREAGAQVQEIVLAPLNDDNLAHLIADALHCETPRAMALAQLVHEKTGGNPFFVNQFIHQLVDERLVTFDPARAAWRWDLGPIRAKGFTDNLVELMVGKLSRLPLNTQEAVKGLACLGNSAEASMLAIVHGTSLEELHSDLWEALRQELIVHSERRYRFVHDRVQEAAYSLVAEEQRAPAHLRIGRLLTAAIEPDKREDNIFEIVGHLNRGSALIASREDRAELAALNLIAGKRAKTAAAYASALHYLLAGAALLPEDSWEGRHNLVFELEFHRAACEFMTGQMAAAEERLVALSPRATNAVERAVVACLLADIHFTRQRPDLGVAACLECLRQAGVDFPMPPTDEQAQAAYDHILSKVEGRSIDELANLPVMTDPTAQATLDVLAKIIPCALSMDRNLLTLIICAAIDLSLEHGNSDSSCFAYEYFGFVAEGLFDNVDVGFRFGRLGHEVVERNGLRQFDAVVRLVFASQAPWAKHGGISGHLIRSAFTVANKTGDPLAAAASCLILVWYLLVAGEPLVEAQKEAEAALEFYREHGFVALVDSLAMQVAYIRNLRGLAPHFGSLDDGRFDERRLESFFATQPHLPGQESEYWIRKLQVRFMARDYVAALDAAIRATGLLWATSVLIMRAEYELYSALTRAAACDSQPAGERRAHLAALAAHGRRLDDCAQACPENFGDRAALVAAEIARIEGRDSDAMQLYEQAIRLARNNGFVNNEALALEIAGRFYAARGLDRIARAYLRDAGDAFRQWGADGKVRQLEAQYPYLTDKLPSSDPKQTILASVEQLDLSTVLKVSQAVQGETDLETLIAAVMRLAVEHAGAERGLLILPHADSHRIEAEARSSHERVTVEMRHTSIGTGDMSPSVLQYVLRTRERVLLQDAATSKEFADDEYLRRHLARSVVCIPLLKQTRLIGIIYLENRLTSGVFTPARMALLEVLASDAAISLENARLYGELQEREARVRRLIDANIIGISIWHVDGRIQDANEEFLRIIGYDREDLVSGRVRWTVLTPPEEHDVALRALEEVRAGGDQKPVERELLRKDGSRVPVLAGGTTFEGLPDEGLGFIIDLTEQKRAEDERKHAQEELRRSEADLHEAQRLSRTGSWKLDLSSGAVRVSPEVLRMFAVQSDEDTSSPDFWFDRIHHEDRNRVREYFERCVAQRLEYEADYRLVLPDGSVRFQHAVGHPIVDESGALREFLGTAMDVTEQVQARVALENALREITSLKDRLSDENLALKEEVDRASMFEEIVGASPTLKAVLSRVAKVAPTDSTVFISGETGTGKELIARAVHKRSQRAGRAFLSVNCAALAPTLISSELFGHEKGAFTGATQRRLGRFELANGGTIFLDEVGELLPDTQVMLLRVLQEREFERVGGTQPVRVDVRVIAATNRDLKAAIATGSFRHDLYYRLNVFPIEVPALRDRKDDLLMLIEYFVHRYATRAGKPIRSIDKKTLELLQAYDWPGNIRELQNVIERSVILSSGGVFTVDELWLSTQSSPPTHRMAASAPFQGESRSEREIIEAALAESRGRIAGPSGAAARLNIPASTLESRIKSLKIIKSQFKFGGSSRDHRDNR